MDRKLSDVLLAGVAGLTVVLSASAVSARCNEAERAEERAMWEGVAEDLASAWVGLRVATDAERARWALERGSLRAERERAWDRWYEESEAASECRVKMNREYGDPGWPVSDPIPVDRYLWVWELACGPWPGPDTTCMTCLKDLNQAHDMAMALMDSCEELRADDVRAACDGSCDQARAAKGRCRRKIEEAQGSAEYWHDEATKLREKYEPEKYTWLEEKR